MSELVSRQSDNRGVCTLMLNRPEKHNALNAALIAALHQQLDAVAKDDSVRVAILTGAGKSFCSGADLEWMRASVNLDETGNREDAERLAALLHTLYTSPKPTIARINGAAYGGGLGLIACCDIAVGVDSAQFAFSETPLGLVPAVISPYIVAAIGTRQARKLFMTAERFSSAEAVRWGLLHHAVADTDLDGSISAQVNALLKAGPQALQECKVLLHKLGGIHTNNKELAALIARLRVSPEGQEGLAAFLEKRNPSWIKVTK